MWNDFRKRNEVVPLASPAIIITLALRGTNLHMGREGHMGEKIKAPGKNRTRDLKYLSQEHSPIYYSAWKKKYIN